MVGSRLGDIPDTAALAQTGIGQRDVAMTPFQMAWITATIANRGDMMAPYLIAKTTKPDLSVISADPAAVAGPGDPDRGRRPDARHDDPVREGHDRAGGIADLVIASKTGTAEHGTDPKNTPPHAWYVAFAPADNPQVAVAVMVENGGDLGLDATGAKVAGADRPRGHRRRARRGSRDVARPGLLLSGRYRLTHRIAVGGMGEVWAADDTRLARMVAREDPASRS